MGKMSELQVNTEEELAELNTIIERMDNYLDLAKGNPEYAFTQEVRGLRVRLQGYRATLEEVLKVI